MSIPYQAVLLAAGRGERLDDETDDWPKALLPIGPRSLADTAQTSFLRRQAELLREAGVRQIVIVVGYQRQRIIDDLRHWGPLGQEIQIVVNPTPEIKTSGSLHSFQYAARSSHNVLDGEHQTLLMDADIVYHRDALHLLLEAPDQTATLICSAIKNDDEEVLVWGSVDAPRFIGKGLTASLADGSPCLGEATGIVKFAPQDHALVRETMDWLIGDPGAPEDSARFLGFGPARRATEHEELSRRFMRYRGRMCAVVFDEKIPFMEVDTPAEYRELREVFYPRLLQLEADAA